MGSTLGLLFTALVCASASQHAPDELEIERADLSGPDCQAAAAAAAAAAARECDLEVLDVRNAEHRKRFHLDFRSREPVILRGNGAHILTPRYQGRTFPIETTARPRSSLSAATVRSFPRPAA